VVVLEDLASLSADGEERLRAFHRAGGGIVLVLGPHVDPQYYTSRLLPGLIDLALDGMERAPEGSAYELRARAPGHTIVEGLAVGVGGSITQARLTQLVRGRVTSPRAEAVIATSGGLPVVVASPGVSVFLGSFGEEWGDLPFAGAFVPLARGLVEHAARAADAAAEAEVHAGQRPVARLSALPAGALVVRGPGDYTSPASIEAEGTGFRAVADVPAREPGFYVFSAAGRGAATVAVNVDPVESDLAPAPPDSLRGAERDAIGVLEGPAALASHLRDTRRGRELWLPLLVVAALLLAGELALGSVRAIRP
jgi:hypothetical protein